MRFVLFYTGIEMLSINPMHTWNKWAGNNIIGKVTTLPNISEQETEMWFIEDRSEVSISWH